jgi:hypothetical protein
VRDGVKNDTGGVIALAAQRIRERWPITELEGFLGPDVLLVPAPRSAPLKDADALWPARSTCEAFVRMGHGRGVETLLHRFQPVQKSAFAGKGTRPTALEHLASIAARELELFRPTHVTVVDDFVTTGATLLACASHLAALWPDLEVRCFGLVCTASDDEPDLERLDSPSAGHIAYNSNTGRTTRRP